LWYRSSGLRGGMGSPARLLALAYRPALVTVVTGIHTPSVAGSEIDRTPNRTAFFCHRPLRVCPSLLFQSSCCASGLEHRYAALPRSANLFGATRSKSSGRLMRAEATVASLFLLFDRSMPFASNRLTISETCSAPSFKSGLIFAARAFLRIFRLGTATSSSSVSLESNRLPAVMYCSRRAAFRWNCFSWSSASLIWFRSSVWFMRLNSCRRLYALRWRKVNATNSVFWSGSETPLYGHGTQ